MMRPKNIKNARSLSQEARTLIQTGNLAEAENLLQQSLSAEPTGEAFHYTGVIHYLRGDRKEARSALLKAVGADPLYARSWANLAALAEEDRNYPAALQYIASAINAEPANDVYKGNLASILRYTSILAFSKQLKDLITLCLQAENLDHICLFPAWHSQLRLDPSFRHIYKLFNEKKYKAFEKNFRKADAGVLLDPFFLLGLKRLILYGQDCERFLTHLRRFLLENHGLGENACFAERFNELWSALATYCFYTEFIFDATSSEKECVSKIREVIVSIQATDSGSDHLNILTLACYTPLADLPNTSALKEILLSATGGKDLVRIQIDEPLEERCIRQSIPALTPICDGMSQNVRAQYEVFPYPRWRTIGLAGTFGNEPTELKKDAEILIAGCGTGYEACRYASLFPQSRILAIDLSLSSLSYAIRKAKELALDNITFGQADLLELKRLDRKFDLVVSTGVLVCVKDPLTAWAGLADMVKPGGLMHVGLYSRIGRAEVTTAQRIVKENAYSSDADGMRRFRRDAPRILEKKTLARIEKASDYYTLSEVRDFLFHVHEICFDITGINNILAALNLEFMKFLVPDFVTNRYRRTYPDDPAVKNLQYWAEFEEKNPETFAALYMLWCRKKI